MKFTPSNHTKLEEIKRKIDEGDASPKEIDTFLNLMQKYDPVSINTYINSIGYSSIDQLKSELKSDKNNRDLMTGLLIISGAILLALFINKK